DVITFMTFYYGSEFASLFEKETAKHHRPDKVVIVTNQADQTPEHLRSKGYQLQRSFKWMSTTYEIWVHPSGLELWRLPPPKGTVVAAKAPPALPALVGRVQEYADTMDEGWQDLYDRAAKLRDRRGAIDSARYQKEYDTWMADYEEWLGD